MNINIAKLNLSDGSSWKIIAENEEAICLINMLSSIMRLSGGNDISFSDFACSLTIPYSGYWFTTPQSPPPNNPKYANNKSDDNEPNKYASELKISIQNSFEADSNYAPKLFTLKSPDDNLALVINLIQISFEIIRNVQNRGGLLLHAALIKKNDFGVLLAGPGNAGKTTACQRLPSAWSSLCDDATLLVKDSQGRYWAHPWPTWSQVISGNIGKSWDVQKATPIRGLFYLKKCSTDAVETVGVAQATCFLAQSAEQVARTGTWLMNKEEIRKFRLQSFTNICEIVNQIPVYILRLSRRGQFWEEIEKYFESNLPY